MLFSILAILAAPGPIQGKSPSDILNTGDPSCPGPIQGKSPSAILNTGDPSCPRVNTRQES